jgi:hypothetical protein
MAAQRAIEAEGDFNRPPPPMKNNNKLKETKK